VPYQPGDIVLADILDPQGQPCDDPHPAMVLRIDQTVCYLVGITTSYQDPPPGHWIRMLQFPGGHPQTGLYRPCVLKCDWVVKFDPRAVIRKMGEMPDDHFEQATQCISMLVEQKKLQLIDQLANPPAT
jgi:hypothetical protein